MKEAVGRPEMQRRRIEQSIDKLRLDGKLGIPLMREFRLTPLSLCSVA